MPGWKSRPKQRRWGRLAPRWNKRDKTNPLKERCRSHKGKRWETVDKMEGGCWLEKIFIACSGHKTWARASVNQRQTKRGGINKSIQVHSYTRYSDICHMHYWPAGQHRDPGDPVLHLRLQNVKNPHNVCVRDRNLYSLELTNHF